LAGNILNNPAEVKLAVSKPAEKIVQAAYVCYENQKLGIIRSLFAEETPERVIIFASSKLKVKEVTKALKQMKLNVVVYHQTDVIDINTSRNDICGYQDIDTSCLELIHHFFALCLHIL
jgi:superfamily II DNA helicase RecQ